MSTLHVVCLTGLFVVVAMLIALRTFRRKRRKRRLQYNRVEIPNEKLIPYIAADIKRGHTVTIIVRGVSMRPFIEHERDKVVLAPITKPLAVGDVILAEYAPKRYALHRIIKLTADSITMQGDGNPYQTETFPPQAVIGRATAFYRKGSSTPLSVESRTWRIYSRIWMALTPIRRYLLGIHRRLILLT